MPRLAPAAILRESGRSFCCSSCALASGFAASFCFNWRQVLRRMTAPTTTSTNAIAPPMPPAMALALLELVGVGPEPCGVCSYTVECVCACVCLPARVPVSVRVCVRACVCVRVCAGAPKPLKYPVSTR